MTTDLSQHTRDAILDIADGINTTIGELQSAQTRVDSEITRVIEVLASGLVTVDRRLDRLERRLERVEARVQEFVER